MKFEKHTLDENKFFNELAEKYGLEQDEEYLIMKKGQKKIYIPKWQKIPRGDKGAYVKIEDYIKELLEKTN